jgi:hypothetical protein
LSIPPFSKPVFASQKAAIHPIALGGFGGGSWNMLKRGRISMALAAVPAAMLYTQLIDFLIPTARLLLFVLIGFSAVSFLFAMFEDEPLPRPAGKPELLRAPEPARLALLHAGHGG